MEKRIRVLMPTDSDAILAFERKKIQSEISDELEASMAEWHARWRTEALEFYLPKGWSFGTFHVDAASGKEVLEAYFLAQPLLFFRGYTQTLWLEYMQYSEETYAKELMDVAYRTAREKHLQKFLVSDGKLFALATQTYKHKVHSEYIDINTTKMD